MLPFSIKLLLCLSSCDGLMCVVCFSITKDISVTNGTLWEIHIWHMGALFLIRISYFPVVSFVQVNEQRKYGNVWKFSLVVFIVQGLLQCGTYSNQVNTVDHAGLYYAIYILAYSFEVVYIFVPLWFYLQELAFEKFNTSYYFWIFVLPVVLYDFSNLQHTFHTQNFPPYFIPFCRNLGIFMHVILFQCHSK